MRFASARLLAIVVAATIPFVTCAGAIDAGSRDDLVPGTVSAIVYGEDQLAELPGSGALLYEYRMEGDIIETPFVDEMRFGFSKDAGETATQTARGQMRSDGIGYAFDISLFTEERRQGLPQMPADTINPLFLVFFQRDTNLMNRNTGGSVHYFRNLIRTAMNQPATAEEVTVELDGRQVAATAVTFRPFSGDQRRGEMGPFANKEYRIVMSDDVPGHVYELQTTVPSADGDGVTLSETYRFKELIQ
jgi:hypothetical protein